MGTIEKIMESGTIHTVTIDARLSPDEQRASYVAECKVWLKSKRRWFPWFLPIFRKTSVIGKAKIVLTHEKTPFPIKVKLPRVRRTMVFEVFVSLLGRDYIAVESRIISPIGGKSGNH